MNALHGSDTMWYDIYNNIYREMKRNPEWKQYVEKKAWGKQDIVF